MESLRGLPVEWREELISSYAYRWAGMHVPGARFHRM